MAELFGNFYCLFESLFGDNLAEYLWGYSCVTGEYTGPNLFYSIGLITVLTALILVLLYYYLPLYLFNHPRSNRWWNWLIILGVNAVTCFCIGYMWVLNDFLGGNIGDCLMYKRGEGGAVVAELILQTDCALFGLVNAILSVIIFFVGSLIFKWKSRNCRYVPF
ncbi:MAG: hypothetical protein ACRC9P_05275 [Bacteroides sp.]